MHRPTSLPQRRRPALRTTRPARWTPSHSTQGRTSIRPVVIRCLADSPRRAPSCSAAAASSWSTRPTAEMRRSAARSRRRTAVRTAFTRRPRTARSRSSASIAWAARGRRPSGLRRPPAARARSAAGAYFARAAHDEAASVHAFARMHDELLAHGGARGPRRRGRTIRARRGPPRTPDGPTGRAARRGCTGSTRAPGSGALAREHGARECYRGMHSRDVRRAPAVVAGCACSRPFAAPALCDHRGPTRPATQRSPGRSRGGPSSSSTPVGARACPGARRRALRELEHAVRARAARDVDRSLGQPCAAAAIALLDGMTAHLART